MSLAVNSRPATPRGLAAVALGLALVAGGAQASEHPWSRLDSPSFTFFSNAGAATTLRYARELETFRSFVARTLGDGAVASPLPTQVYLFADSRGFADFSLGEQNVGWFTSTRQANMIAVDTSSPGGTEVAYHEYVHFVVENSTPAVPLWLNEGLAEFYSSLRIVARGLEIGHPLERHVDFLRRHRLIAFDDLFAMTREAEGYTEERRRGVFYAQSWAFVHYLLVGQRDLHVEVASFLGRLRDGDAAEDAYGQAFGTTTVGLRRDLEHYVGRGLFEILVLPGDDLVAEDSGEMLPLDEAEASARLALLRLAGGVGGEAAAEALLSAALEIDPDNATTLRGMGELDLRRGDFLQAAAWFAEALAYRPDDVACLDLHGLALLQAVQAGLTGAGAPDADQRELVLDARASFARASALASDFAPALSGFGTTHFWDEDPAPGIEASARAVRLLPRNAIILSTHLALVAQAGLVERARRVYDWLRRPAVRPTAKNLADAENALFNAEYQRLIRAHRTPESYPQLLAALEALIGEAPDAVLQAELHQRIDQLREIVERNHWVDTFNRALDLLNAGEHRAGLALLEDVAATSDDPHIVGQAEDILGAADPTLQPR
jgi:tetratricopeptide (TPR) repeat protein